MVNQIPPEYKTTTKATRASSTVKGKQFSSLFLCNWAEQNFIAPRVLSWLHNNRIWLHGIN